MTDRLHLDPLWGREPKLADRCSGYLANPLVQPRASKLPLASIAAWLRGGDQLDGWSRAIEPLRDWLKAAADCDAPGLQGEAAPWLDQVHAEARLGLDGIKLVKYARNGKFEKALDQAFAVGVVWAAARRADKSVMGPRFGLQPMLGQRRDGTWSFHIESILEDRNAVDALLHACLKFYARRSTA